MVGWILRTFKTRGKTCYNTSNFQMGEIIVMEKFMDLFSGVQKEKKKSKGSGPQSSTKKSFLPGMGNLKVSPKSKGDMNTGEN